MTRAPSFHRLAERELNEAAQYYDSESPGLGVAFLNEVERCIRNILEHPEAGSVLVGAVPLCARMSETVPTPEITDEGETG